MLMTFMISIVTWKSIALYCTKNFHSLLHTTPDIYSIKLSFEMHVGKLYALACKVHFTGIYSFCSFRNIVSFAEMKKLRQEITVVVSGGGCDLILSKNIAT